MTTDATVLTALFKPQSLYAISVSPIGTASRIPGWRGFADLSENWWTEERPEEALRVATFLRFLQEMCLGGMGHLEGSRF